MDGPMYCMKCMGQFVDELASSELLTTVSDDVKNMLDLYSSTLTTLIDKHAPEWAVSRR